MPIYRISKEEFLLTDPTKQLYYDKTIIRITGIEYCDKWLDCDIPSLFRNINPPIKRVDLDDLLKKFNCQDDFKRMLEDDNL